MKQKEKIRIKKSKSQKKKKEENNNTVTKPSISTEFRMVAACYSYLENPENSRNESRNF